MEIKTHLQKVLESGIFAVTAEIEPPKNADPEVIREKARWLKGYVDAVNITDSPRATVKMSSLASAVILIQEGIEPVMHITCRDRNRIAIQSDLLGASALGIKNVLCLTGDYISLGNHPQAKPVFDLDSIQLLSLVKKLCEGKFFNGEEIKGKRPYFFIGAVENPFADPLEFRPIRLAKKIKAGAKFIQTQIVYNLERFKKFINLCEEMGILERVYILAGITPPKSSKMLKYMKKNKVPGIEIPDEIIKRMESAKDEKEEGINIAVEIIERVREIPGIKGVHIMAIGWESIVPEIVKRAKLCSRPEL
ncbi:MAG: 5,10-methylenetetrahydrofolate reductase [Thermodesulfobacterium geofontis]|mgnify:CR=1 FL=1|uniref:Methylenetetrahydrofolate reductase n=1 Tax=Thermodesulfobacterium geofontis TaxID=1295609 RepID=A0A2N7Q7U3_9BACT|nr:MAG: 5,10-methylenetetrahydrofolate reductase [Thermodesulfobacterium geofontis]PMP94225.1 MAG: 5,10-methylenetetrahydrofolate reductase [Thermodesulfobacterium geofontis]